MQRQNLLERDKTELVSMIEELHHKLKRKNQELAKVRARFNLSKTRTVRLQNAVSVQRERILELYKMNSHVSK